MIELLHINPKNTFRSSKRKKKQQQQYNENFNLYSSIKNISNNNVHQVVNESFYGNSENIVVSGWLRVYWGPYRYAIDYGEPSKIININTRSSNLDIIRDLNVPFEYTLWVQIGGSFVRRLNATDRPLLIQDNFLKEVGYSNFARRYRLGIDKELKHAIRFYIGPGEIPMYPSILKSGCIEVLIGLVFPQWKLKAVALLGRQLIIFSGNTSATPEIYDLTYFNIMEHQACYNRLILKIVSKCMVSCSNIALNRSGHFGAANNSICSINSYASNEFAEKNLFFGFKESWERDLWLNWLLESSIQINDDKCVNICGAGLEVIPEVALKSMETVEELLAGQNKLQEIGLSALVDLQNLKILRLPGNKFETFPRNLLNLNKLIVLDLSDNDIKDLPSDIHRLESLEELWIDRNQLTELPQLLKKCKKLHTLQIAQNKLSKLPAFLIKMRTLGLVDMYHQKPCELKKDNVFGRDNNLDQNHLNPPLTKVSLRANQLRGSIILGNYGHLTQLDVSENDIEILDLSALDKLETLQCSRNNLSEITLNGRVLRSLIAGNNDLTKLCITPAPIHLNHLDISYNKLEKLPDWIVECNYLRTLFASNNFIDSLPEHFFMCRENFSLNTLQLDYNKLRRLPPMPKETLALQELFLQNNLIVDLPENFFSACNRLTLLNISSNRLMTLPIVVDGKLCLLERLYATNNCLTDRVLDTLAYLRKIKILYAAYNSLTTFPESCATNWPDLEELVLSGNKLQHLPDNLANMSNLKILRVHSNQLQSVPPLARLNTLRVLDLAHNQLDKINLVSLVSKKLKFLDLSCNMQLQVDPNEYQVCRTQRFMSLVDVSGKNRQSLPSTPNLYQENIDFEPPWKIGFSETSGNTQRLFISQLRLPCFCNNEGLFGLFDGESSRIVPQQLVTAIPKILLDERTVKETASDYMKYTLLSAHRELKQQGQKQGVCAILCHISLGNDTNAMTYNLPNMVVKRRFVLRVASVGEASAMLIRQSGSVRLTPSTQKRQIGNSANFPIIIPDPEVCELTLGDQDEFLVIANKRLWEVMDADSLTTEIRKESNVILAAKRIQDVAQSYGVEENISIIILKLNNIGTDVDYLMRELRQTIVKKPFGNGPSNTFCKCGCCCESNNSCCHSGAGAMQFFRQPSGRSDRSSPSGQSDHTTNESVAFIKKNDHMSTIGSRRSSTSNNYTQNDRRSLRSGVVRAVRARIEEENERERDETDSTLSEEQFKCWEYMLEQNTQLLFDKELNTISKAFSKNLNTSNLSRAQMKLLSSSTPQLSYNEHSPKPVVAQYHSNNNVNAPLLSKKFGSARSFHPHSPGLFKSLRLNGSDRFQAPPINGGPNAAYFGSLQRLMPYNLEYDFAVMQERLQQEDSLDYDRRMQQYWGVATTEL